MSRIVPSILFILLLATSCSRHPTAVARRSSALSPSGQILPTQAIGTLPGALRVTQDGAATYSLPLTLPDGRAGVQPALALTYSSRAANGLIGVGWSLSGLSSITRCARVYDRDGESRSVRFDASDRYCLDGARLVAVRGTYGAAGTEYRTEPDTFVKVLQGDDELGVPARFTAWTKDGRVITFGGTSDGVAEAYESQLGTTAPAHLQRWAWLVTNVADRSGNFYQVTWNHVQTDMSTQEYEPGRIDYTGGPSLAPNRSVTFEYDTTRADPLSAWQHGSRFATTRRLTSIVAHGPLTSGGATSVVRRYDLAYEASPTSGRSRLATVTMCDGGGACIPPTRFSYSNDTPAFTYVNAGQTYMPEPQSIFVLDADGDGRDDLLFGSASGLDLRFGGAAGLGPANPLGAFRPIALAYDADGDNRVDLLTQWPDSTCVKGDCELNGYIPRFYQSNGWTFVANPAFDLPEYPSQPDAQFLFDFDGDGNGDYLARYAGTWGVESALAGIVQPWQYQLTNGTDVLDLDGDGKNELLLPYWADSNGTSSVYYGIHSRGRAGSPEAIVTNLYVNACTAFVDVNGDGLLDAVNLRDPLYNVSVRVNQGNGVFSTSTAGLAPGTPWTVFNNCAWVYRRGGNYVLGPEAGVRVIDYNQDGLGDLLILGKRSTGVEYATVLVARPDNTFTVQTVNPDHPIALHDPLPVGDGAVRSRTLDVNGDGLTDFFQPNPQTGELELYVQSGTRADLLTNVTDGLGAQSAVDYAPLDATSYRPPQRCSYPDRCYSGPLMVVTNEWADTGRFGLDERLDLVAVHQYAGAFANTAGDGFLGFTNHTVTDPRTGRTTRTTYAPTATQLLAGSWRHSQRGLPIETLSWISDGAVWHATRTRTSYQSIESDGYALVSDGAAALAWFTVPTATTTQVYEGAALDPGNPDGVFDVASAPGVLSVTTTSSFGYDAFGNGGTTQTITGPSATYDSSTHWRKTVTRTYQSAPASWLVAAITDERITSEAPTPAGSPVRVETREVAHDPDPTTGLDRSSTVEPGDTTGSYFLKTALRRDSFGQPIAVSVCTGASECRTSTTTYDAADGFIHVVATTNALGHTVSATWFGALDARSSRTDANGAVTRFDVDGFGRARAMTPTHGIAATIDFSSDATAPLIETTAQSNGGKTIARKDQRGRVTLTQNLVFDGGAGQLANVATTYDRMGRVACVSRPYFAGATTYWSPCYEYDPLGRTIRVHRADYSQFKSTAYSGLTTTSVDEGGATSAITVDAAGHVARNTVFTTIPPSPTNALVTDYQYGPFDTLVGVAYGGNSVGMTYDRLGRQIDLRDPDLGHVVTRFDAFGEIVATTDGKGQTTTLDYDLLGRMKTRSAPDGSDSWTYDQPGALGRLASSSRGTIATSYSYDGDGHVTNEHWSVDGAGYDFDYAYDALGRIARQTYPAGDEPTRFAVDDVYDATGALAQVKTGSGLAVWTAQLGDADGHVTRETLGNQLYTTREYEADTGRLSRINTPGIPYYAYDVRYQYQPNGNMAARTDAWQSRTESFTYDGANRVATETLSGAAPAQYAYGSTATFSYDALGNLTASTDWRRDCHLSFGEGAGPHAPTNLHCAAYSYLFPITYDANGNLTWNYSEGLTAAWTSFNKPLEIQNGYGSYGRVHYTYDADHRRIKKETLDATGSEPYAYWSGVWGTTISLGGYERRSGGRMTTVDNVYFISVGGRKVAQRMWRTANGAGSEQWAYFHTDLFGSVERTTDAHGNAQEWASYDAFGGHRGYQWDGSGAGPNPLTRDTYAGHQGDDEFGYVNMGARLYNPLLKTFLSPDTVVQAPFYAPSWNRYSYAFDNPLRYLDPSGHAASEIDNTVLSAVSGLTGMTQGEVAGVVDGGDETAPATVDDEGEVHVNEGSSGQTPSSSSGGDKGGGDGGGGGGGGSGGGGNNGGNGGDGAAGGRGVRLNVNSKTIKVLVLVGAWIWGDGMSPEKASLADKRKSDNVAVKADQDNEEDENAKNAKDNEPSGAARVTDPVLIQVRETQNEFVREAFGDHHSDSRCNGSDGGCGWFNRDAAVDSLAAAGVGTLLFSIAVDTVIDAAALAF